MQIEHAGKKGYRVINHTFEPRELRLMIDSVQSAKFITQDEATSLTSKIKDLADKYTRDSLNRKAFVSERISSSKESIVARTDVIHEAINSETQISFKYVHYQPSFSKGNKRYSKNGEPYIVSPFALYWNNGNYYLYAYVTEREEMRFFRIDRMESIKLTSLKVEGKDKYSEKTLRSQKKAKVFDMYGGEVADVRLRAHSSIADAVVDAFGQKLMIPTKEDKDYFTVDVSVEISPTFFAWLTNFGNKIEISKPQKVREQFASYIQNIIDLY